MNVLGYALELAAARLVPLTLVAPLGPLSARLVLGALLSVVVASGLGPVVGHDALPLLAAEAGIGLVLGLLVAAFVAAAEAAGGFVDELRRGGRADLHRHPVWSRALRLLALVAFFVTGGHQVLLDALGRSYAALPPGQVPAGGVAATIEAMDGLVLAALELALPIVAVMLVTEVVAALVARAAPEFLQSDPTTVTALGGAVRELGTAWAVALSLTTVLSLLAAYATGLGGVLLDAARRLAVP